jgi:hypothetical protein
MEEINMATFNKNEVVLEKVKQASLYDLETGILLNRLTSIEDPSLNTTAEKEEVVDAQGNTITDIYRAKKATFGGSNSLFSLDLAASQFGAKKEVATSNKKIVNYMAETMTIATETKTDTDGTEIKAGTVKLSQTPVANSIKYIYIIEGGEIGESIAIGATAADATTGADGKVTPETAVVGNNGVITLPPARTSGKVYVEYAYESEEAVRIVNKTNEYPTAGKLVILALFRDKCTDKTILGSIICPKAKLNPESVDLSLTPTGKHPFEYTMMKDYCSDEEELFEIVLSK